MIHRLIGTSLNDLHRVEIDGNTTRVHPFVSEEGLPVFFTDDELDGMRELGVGKYEPALGWGVYSDTPHNTTNNLSTPDRLT